MSSTSFSSPMFSLTIPDHCTPTNSFLFFISSAFNTCVPTPLAFLSTLLGFLSIGAWLFALPPQLYKNYALGSASGLSVFFLAEWFLGDLTNMIGAIFTEQATWQITNAAYFVMVDVILCGQYIWYTHLKLWRERKRMEEDKSLTPDDGSGYHEDPRGALGGIRVMETMEETTAGNAQNLPKSSTACDDRKPTKGIKPPTSRQNSRKPTPHTTNLSEKLSHPKIIRTKSSPLPLAPSQNILLVLSILCTVLARASPLSPLSNPPSSHTIHKPLEFPGRILSWSSSILYLGSRLPQIYRNHTRRSTTGLSPSLFAAAFTGNLFYSTSVVSNPSAWNSCLPYGLRGWCGAEGSDQWNWVALAAPFWLGTAGVLALDATIGVQFLRYGVQREGVEVREQGGRGRWRRVKGWMRGWVPSPSPEPATGEESRLLDHSGGERGYGGA